MKKIALVIISFLISQGLLSSNRQISFKALPDLAECVQDPYDDNLPDIDLDKLAAQAAAADAQKANNGLLEQDLILTAEQWQECQALAGGAEESDPTVASNNSYCVPAPAHSFDGTGLNNARLGFTEAELEEIEKEYAKTHPASQQALQFSQQYACPVPQQQSQPDTATLDLSGLALPGTSLFTQKEQKGIMRKFVEAKIEVEKTPFKCRTCNKSFTQAGTLKVHERTHTGEKPYTCEICGKSFSDYGNFTRHKRIHTGEKPFACEYCSKSFSDSSNLREHERIHTGKKPFACECCGKSFSDSSHLRRHERTHTGKKPFACEYCSKSFTTSSDLRRHKKESCKSKPQ